MSDVKGGNVKRLTNNQHYDAEVSVSPDGKWIVFGREIDGKNDLWVMKSDGTGEHQITHTADWQEGHPFFLPDNERIMFRAWRKSEIGKIKPTPMTIFTVKKDGTDMRAHTFDHDMNWAPYPAPDGHRFIFVRIVENNNWEVFIGDMAAPRGTAPVRLTFNDGFDGLPNISPNGRKVSFARSTKPGFMAGIRTFIMDVSPLKMGPENYVKFDPKWGEPVSGE
jgi:Tol biopolymer transport system component